MAQPKMEIKENKKNFGAVKRGEIVSTEFEISNIGNEPLLLTNAEVACSCTTVDFPNHPILPKETEKIKVTFNTTTVYGRQDRIVLISSNDPSSPHKLRFKAAVSTK